MQPCSHGPSSGNSGLPCRRRARLNPRGPSPAAHCFHLHHLHHDATIAQPLASSLSSSSSSSSLHEPVVVPPLMLHCVLAHCAPTPIRRRLPCSRAGELLHAPAPFSMNMLPCFSRGPEPARSSPQTLTHARDPDSCTPGWCLSLSPVAIRDRAVSAPASVEYLLMATLAALYWLLVCNRQATDVRAASLVKTA